MRFILALFLSLLPYTVIANDGSDIKENVENGAVIFQSRCTLCHGNFGMGEGILPLILKDYPDTNLLSYNKETNLEKLRASILHGGATEGTSEFSPPWINELSNESIDSVARFVALYYSNNDAALALLEKTRQQVSTKSNINIGAAIYRSRCVICHGPSGMADGVMAKRLRVPPANLVLSRQDDTYLKKIITDGGESVSRSFQMPPWEGTLTASEVDSVILHIKSLRKN